MSVPYSISDLNGLRTYVNERAGDGWSDGEIDQMVDALRGLDGWRWPMRTTDMIELLDAKGIECFSQLLEVSDG
jgi:hypothetical protein